MRLHISVYARGVLIKSQLKHICDYYLCRLYFIKELQKNIHINMYQYQYIHFGRKKVYTMFKL